MLILTIVSIRLEAFERFVLFSQSHEAWELDEFAVVTFFGGLGSIGLLLLRARDLRREIAQREAAERRASALARHDALTGLPNRRLFQSTLDAALRKSEAPGAVILIDLDRFKAVNDIYGHAAGDELLVRIAALLKEIVHPSDLVARLGGDGFGCVVTSCTGSEELATLAGRITHAIGKPMELGGGVLHTGATAGIAQFPRNGQDANELLRAADIALYQGKREGRAHFRFFDADLDKSLAERAQLEGDLRAALARSEIQPFFQPLALLANSEIVGFEALARWFHPTRGVIGPDIFIPIAEDIGLLNSLTDSILADACRTALTWPPHTKLSINVAPVQLKDPWFAARVLAVLKKVGFEASRLIVEVTESTVVQEFEAASANLKSLQNSGVGIALDDFGQGYSSLSYLHKLKFDHIKIDRAFVMSLDEGENRKIVSAVMGFAKALDMPVTAEGIESASTAEELWALGCEYGQGNLIGRPMPAAKTQQCLRAAWPPHHNQQRLAS